MNAFRFYLGLFLVTAATLMLQLIQTRILSVVLWYHLAFFVISIAMFGLTAGAVWVYAKRDRFTPETLPQDLASHTGALAVTIVVALAVQMTLAPTFQPSLTFVAIWVELALVIAAPFFLSGIVISLALTRSPFPIGRVYGVDMLGAAAGCPGAVLLLTWADGPSAVIWVAALTAWGAACFASAVRQTTATGRRWGIAGLAFAALALANDASSFGLRPLFVKDQIEPARNVFLLERWNAFSRVTAIAAHGRSLYGPSPKLGADAGRDMRVLSIDGRASTPMYPFSGNLRDMAFLRFDVTNLAYALPGRQRGAVIGVGGGRDVLAARALGLAEVTGIEINPIFIDVLTRDRDFADYAGLDRLAGVRFVVDEARSWFARSEETFDIVQMSMIDTWAATGAGAFTLSENGLYTTEAWNLLLERLAPDGVLTVSRWYAPGDVNETGRMISLATATLLDRGVAEPQGHLFAAATSRVATLLVSPSPFSPADLAALMSTVEELGFRTLVAPHAAPASETLRDIVTASDRRQLERRTSNLDLDLSPPTDDQPFFFNQLPFYRPAKVLELARGERPEGGVVAGNLQAAATLLVILLVSSGLALATIVVPLRSAVRASSRRLVVSGTLWFFLIGVGFMMVEIGLLQRMSVFLGHPIYAFAVVLFSIILTTGLGSFASDRFVLDRRRRIVAWAVATGGLLLTLPAWWGEALLRLDGAALPVRIAFAVAVILPIGVLLGFGFPTGMRLAAAEDTRPTPWFWGINGAAGVVGSTFGLATSIAFGIQTTVVCGAVCYLLLPLAASGLGLKAEPSSGAAARAG